MMTEWTKTDDSLSGVQWQRKDGSTYEMCQIMEHELEQGKCCWFAWHETFSIDEFDEQDVAWVYEAYGYKIGEISNDVLAECLFESSAASFSDVEQFFTEEDAMHYIDGIIKR